MTIEMKIEVAKIQRQEMNSLISNVISMLNGVEVQRGSVSVTDWGCSGYFYVNGIKTRISNHSVMSYNRMMNEIHLDSTWTLDRMVTNIMNALNPKPRVAVETKKIVYVDAPSVQAISYTNFTVLEVTENIRISKKGNSINRYKIEATQISYN